MKWVSTCSSIICWQDSFLYWNVFCILARNQFYINMKDCFRALYCLIDLFVSNSKTTLPWPLALWVLEWSSDSPFLFKKFFLSCLSIIDPFYFYINFTISLSISTNIQVGILIEVAMSLFIYQIRWEGENCHFDSTEFSNLCT